MEPDRLTLLAIGLAVFLGFLFCIIIHEVAHAVVALMRGDDTALKLGRITLDPLPHIDLFMSVILPVFLWVTTRGSFVFGGAKPVPYNPRNFRNPRHDQMLVAGAGPASNLVLAIAIALIGNLYPLLARLNPEFGANFVVVIFRLVSINLVLAAFNLIPIPPLDGSKVLAGLLPPAQGNALLRFNPFIGLVMVAALAATDLFRFILEPVFLATFWIIRVFGFTYFSALLPVLGR